LLERRRVPDPDGLVAGGAGEALPVGAEGHPVDEGYRAVVEDRAEVIGAGGGLVLAVADGAGGRPGGAQGADAVIGGVRAAAAATSPLPDAAAGCRLLADLDRAVLDAPGAGETTAVVASVSAVAVDGASAGDSGAWVLAPGARRDLTARQQRRPFLGTGAARPVPFAAALPPGCTLLLASDGLLKYAAVESIAAAVGHGDAGAAARCLVDLVRLPSGGLQDDVAVVLCRPPSAHPHQV
jgi:hypothetical protein